MFLRSSSDNMLQEGACVADFCAFVFTACLAILNFIHIGLGQIQSLPYVNISILKLTPIQLF